MGRDTRVMFGLRSYFLSCYVRRAVLIVFTPGSDLPSHLLQIRHQVVRNTAGVLPDAPRWVSADRIEVAEQADVELWVGLCAVAQDLLVEKLGEACGGHNTGMGKR